MAPPSDTCRQRGGRPVRQPRISGRTLRQCNIAEISLHNQAQRATNGLHGHQGMNSYHCQVWHRTEFNWQRKTRVRQRLDAAPIHRHLAGLLILARSCSISCYGSRWILSKSGHMKSQSEYNDVLARKRPQNMNSQAIRQQVTSSNNNLNIASIYL